MTGAGALSGVRVVDFGHYVAGPLAALMLADQGADVIHVDRPGAVPAGADAFLNRNKRRITLDLKDSADLDVARELVRRADVLIENFRPGVMDRLGLGWAWSREASPGLLYCSLPGFAAADPRAGVPGWEGVIAAATGNCRIRAGYVPAGWDPTRPTYSAIPVASNFAAFCGAFAIVAGLTSRHRTGRGDRIEVPLYHAMFEAIGGSGAYPVARGLQPERAIRANGSGTYRCADGRHVQFNPIGATTRFLTWFLDAAGVAEWAGDGLTDRPRMDREPHLRDLLEKRLTALFLTRPALEWEELADAAGVPLAMVRTTAEWLESAHARATGEVVVLDDPLLGPAAMPGSPVSLSRTPAVPGRARSLPGGDRAEILAELAGPPVPVRHPRGGGLPYEGRKVVDLTQILAGPSAGRILAEFGADVVKINVPQRWVGAHGFVNRGKRTMLLDVKSSRGQEVLWRLIDEADVLTHNFPGRTADGYGLGYQHVRARRPDIVYVSVGCFARGGPWSDRRGYETQGQAATGIMARAGGEGPPAVFGPYNVLDYGTGTMAAFAAALGLYHLETTGQGQHAHTSLTQTGLYQQAWQLPRPLSGLGGLDARGPAALGPSPWQRYYQAADGWFFLGATEAQLPVLRRLAGLNPGEDSGGNSVAPAAPGNPTAPGSPEGSGDHEGSGIHEALGNREGSADAENSGDLGPALAAAFRADGAAVWVERLIAAGVGAHPVTSLGDLMTDPRARALGLTVQQVSEEAGDVVMPGLAITAEGNPPRLGEPVRRPGADGREVLDRIGLGDAADTLARGWAVQLDALPPGWNNF
ncbi:hypothetical protein Aph01nite_49200 [Acrocarpospora phusangensis]|uniref:CoA transferase n=1 Tax=Acrocarpospora phusangensis TaxID=1070424 RepID=A0A919QFU1_9ACTN|nr:CoA transferase [Acrocarpospora phusangensis]GIH26610.1 hypothetical protein Aph01nite_49200 [Acrocarpospora phusangensis]